MLPGADQNWRPLDPRIACLGSALVQLARHETDARALRKPGWTIVAESEKFHPDLLELGWAWEWAQGILIELLDAGRGGPLTLYVLEEMERLSL